MEAIWTTYHEAQAAYSACDRTNYSELVRLGNVYHAACKAVLAARPQEEARVARAERVDRDEREAAFDMIVIALAIRAACPRKGDG